MEAIAVKTAAELALKPFGEWAVRTLPTWIGRWRYGLTPDKLAHAIYFHFPEGGGVQIGASGDVPSLDLALEVDNFGPLAVILDRIVIDVWAGQPIAYGVMADRRVVTMHGRTGLISWRTTLAEGAVRRWEAHRNQPSASIDVRLRAYFDSRYGPFAVMPARPLQWQIRQG